MISAKVAPSLRRSRSRMMAFLENSRGTLASFGWAAVLALGCFLAGAALASFFGLALASFLAAAFLAFFWPLGTPFFWLASFFEEAFSGATVAPCSATAAASVAVAATSFVMVVFLILSGGLSSAHDDSSLRSARKASGFFENFSCRS